MGRAGYYKCDACRGEGKREVRSGNDTDWESSTSRIEDCDKCDGSGRVYYHENGETYRERILRQNREERENLRYYHRPCFPYRTLIDTPYGKAKIGSLQKGQLVLSYDAGQLVPRAITRKRVRGIAQVLRVEFDDGKMLFTTAHHTFLTEGGWKKLADIHLGEKLVKVDGSTSRVTRFTKLAPEEMKSFKFEDVTAAEAQKLFNEKTKGRKPLVSELLKKFSKSEAQALERLKITWSVEKFLQKRVETLTPIITQDEVKQSFQLQKSRFAGKSFESVQEELSRELRKERLRKSFEAWVLSLREKYNYTNYLDAG